MISAIQLNGLQNNQLRSDLSQDSVRPANQTRSAGTPAAVAAEKNPSIGPKECKT